MNEEWIKMTVDEVLSKFEESVSLMISKPLLREKRMIADLNTSSMDYMMMCAVMEENGAGHVDYNKLRKCETWGDILNTLTELLQKNSSAIK